MTLPPAPLQTRACHHAGGDVAATRRTTAAAPAAFRSGVSTHVRQLHADDAGMTTAEYAVGMIAACGFAAVLLKLLTSGTVFDLLAKLIERALTSIF